MTTEARPAPPWHIDQWFNTPAPLSLESLRGKVVVVEAFQMLCPGCVSHGLPQAGRIHATFPAARVTVVGLHAVFEHHDAMAPLALQAFLHEYRIGFPVGVDRPGTQGPIPQTMQAYAMRGTPTLLLIDAGGRLRHQHFGQVGDLAIGAQIASLLHEAQALERPTPAALERSNAAACDDSGCPLPNS